MAQVKLLKISADGVPLEFDSSTDEVTLATFTAGTAFLFSNPATGYFNQTAGNLVADNVMAKERENLMTTAGGISFPVITDVAGQVDSLRIPAIAGIPTATPSTGGEGHIVWSSTMNRLYAWDGSAWDDQSTAEEAERVMNTYIADEAIAAMDALYISAADNVSKALADNTSKSYAIGFAAASAADTNPVNVVSEGLLTGFSGLVAGSRYYLDDTTAGAISTTVPSGSGKTIVQMGYAKNATTMQIHIEQMGRRA